MISSGILDDGSQRNTWKNKEAYDAKANELAAAFNKNFEKFAAKSEKEILDAAPKVMQAI